MTQNKSLNLSDLFCLKWFAIFIGIGIFKDTQIGVVPRLRYATIVKSFKNGTSWFVSVSAVAISAIM